MGNKRNVKHNDILELIKCGEENAIHLSGLMTLTGLSNRELRAYIEGIRRSGTIIISSSKGYYRPKDKIEVEKYIRQEERRAKSIFFTLRTAKNYLKELGSGKN